MQLHKSLTYFFNLYFQAKNKFIMLKVLKELSVKNTFRPISDEASSKRGSRRHSEQPVSQFL
jgi:hypothetical protein